MTVTTAPMELRSSPHIRRAASVDTIMFNVAVALTPICAFAIYLFGISALALILTTTATCVLAEHLFCRATRKDSTVSDYSSAITGLLLGLTLPPGFPLWMGVVGSFAAMALGKLIFGGLGFNTFNPALVGRAFLQAAFPVAITTWTPALAPGRFLTFIPSTLAAPFMKPASVKEFAESVDGWTGATALGRMKFEGIVDQPVSDLLFGMCSGSTGETAAWLILICGAYLVARKMMNWRIPAAMLLSAYVFSQLFHWAEPTKYPDGVFMLLSGGLMLGAVFMASDMVASPLTPRGVWIYGTLMGAITVIIRLKGGLPEGVMYAILLGNAVSPIIDNLTQPRVYGAKKLAVKK